MSNGNQLVKSEDQMDIIPFDTKPDYLPDTIKNTGMEGMDKEDFKIPRILLLQPLSPQIQTFEGFAKANQFWHTGMNIPLGPYFDFVPATANKRVILWRPRDDNQGGILAFSKNGKTWDTGANQEFRVKIKNVDEPVIWNTQKDVLSSRLTEFGTANPDDAESAPAATTVYEYLCYLPAHPELSPCVLGVSKTGLPNGKSFNTSLAMITRQNKPIWCVGVRCFADQMTSGNNKWTVPNFKLLGFVPKPVYEQAQKIAEAYGDYELVYSQEEEASNVKDEIAY